MTETINVLLVDDDKFYTEMLSEMLREKEINVDVVHHVDGLMELLEKASHQYDVVISDDAMYEQKEDKSSLLAATITSEIKQRYPHIEVIVISGYGSADSAAELYRLGAYRVLQKPFEINELVFILNTNSEIKKLREQVNSIAFDETQDDGSLTRVIEFLPEYRLAGISILGYFADKLGREYQNQNVKVGIEQVSPAMVRMVVQTEDGALIEQIEQNLEEYALVLQGKLSPSSFETDPLQIIRLEQQLQITKLQVETERRIHLVEKDQLQERVVSLEREVELLHSHIGSALLLSDNAIKSTNLVIEHSSDQNKTLLNGLLSLSQDKDELLSEAINSLVESLQQGSTDSVEELQDNLAVIQQKSPPLLEEIKSFAIQAVSSTSGQLLYDAILKLPL